MVSKLFIDIPPTYNLKTMRVLDSSFYNEDIDITCGRLEVTPPGFDYPVVINAEPYFNLVLNSSNLGLSRVSKYTDLADLPDGVYKIKYSIAPNDKVWVEYDYLRNQQLLEKFFALYCRLKLSNLDPNRDQSNKLAELAKIKQYIDASKIEVEYCGNPDKGLEAYEYANRWIDKLGDGQCMNCKNQ